MGVFTFFSKCSFQYICVCVCVCARARVRVCLLFKTLSFSLSLSGVHLDTSQEEQLRSHVTLIIS